MEMKQTVGTKKYEEETVSESFAERMDRARDEYTATRKASYEALYTKITCDALPALKGSEKQIAWAEKIRTTAQAVIMRNYRPYSQISEVEKVDDRKIAQMRGRVSDLAQMDASWWINNRSRWGM